MEDIFQTTTRAVGGQNENSGILNRCSDEGDDIFVAYLGHLFQLFADVSGQIYILVTDGFDGHYVPPITAGSGVHSFQAQVTSWIPFNAWWRPDASVTAVVVIRAVMAAKRH